jgi:prepilin-type N-terminal cleavage/methylation domain-containing protein
MQNTQGTPVKTHKPILQRIRGKEGFTLLELILVMMLVAVVLGFTSFIALGTLLPSARFSTTARDVSATIREARSLARVSGDRQVVNIDLDTGMYGIDGRKTRAIPRDTGILIRDPFEGEVRRGKQRIAFNPSGNAENRTIVLWRGRKTVSIQTDPVVGAVLIK